LVPGWLLVGIRCTLFCLHGCCWFTLHAHVCTLVVVTFGYCCLFTFTGCCWLTLPFCCYVLLLLRLVIGYAFYVALLYTFAVTLRWFVVALVWLRTLRSRTFDLDRCCCLRLVCCCCYLHTVTHGLRFTLRAFHGYTVTLLRLRFIVVRVTFTVTLLLLYVYVVVLLRYG